MTAGLNIITKYPEHAHNTSSINLFFGTTHEGTKQFLLTKFHIVRYTPIPLQITTQIPIQTQMSIFVWRWMCACVCVFFLLTFWSKRAKVSVKWCKIEMGLFVAINIYFIRIVNFFSIVHFVSSFFFFFQLLI